MPSVSKLIGQTTRAGRGVASFALGKLNAVVNSTRGPKADMTDATLKSKVETELFRGAEVPKGDIEIVVVDHVVELRGQVKRPEIKKSLEAQARAIPEVREVRNLLHLPKTPAPTRADSPGSASRTASTGRFSTEQPTTVRDTAPLGSQEPKS